MDFMERFLTRTFPRVMGELGKKAVNIGSKVIINELTRKDETENKSPPNSTADLKGMSEKMKNAGKTSSEYGGCFFGEINGRAFSKSAEKDGHILIVGGSGSGKSSCFAIPSIIRWREAVFCIDVKGELYKKAGYIKRNVKVFDPMRITDTQPCGYNPFYLLDKARNKAQEAHAMATALIPLSPDDREPMWIINAQNMLTGALLHYHSLGYSFIETMKQVVSKPVDELLLDINDNATDKNSKLYINQFINMSEKQLSSVYSELHRHIILFATDKDIQRSLNHKRTMTPDDLLTDKQNHDIFVCIPEYLLNEWKPLLSLIITQFLRHFEQLPEKSLFKPFNSPKLQAVEIENRRVLFLIDEFARIGKLDGIENALATLRSKNITICLIIQSLAQLDVIYGEKQRQVIAENCSYKAVFNALDADTQDYFSRIIGTYDKHKQITGKHYEIITGLPTGRNISVTTEEKRIIKPEEFATLHDVIVLTPEGFFRVDKLPYYKDPAYIKIEEKTQGMPVNWYERFRAKEKKRREEYKKRCEELAKSDSTVQEILEKTPEKLTHKDITILFLSKSYKHIHYLYSEKNVNLLSQEAFEQIYIEGMSMPFNINKTEIMRDYHKAKKRRQEAEKQERSNDEKEKIEVVELYNDYGENMLFEILARVENDGAIYFVVTELDESDPNPIADTEIPADIFIFVVVEINGQKQLEPVEEHHIRQKIVEKFKKAHSDKYSFIL